MPRQPTLLTPAETDALLDCIATAVVPNCKFRTVEQNAAAAYLQAHAMLRARDMTEDELRLQRSGEAMLPELAKTEQRKG